VTSFPDLHHLTSRLPDRAHDDDRIRRGQEVFNAWGLEMGAALCFAALPLGYALLHGGVAMSRTSDFATANLTRRIGETGQMLIDAMGTRDPNALPPGGRGHTTAVALRIVHGCVRALLNAPDAQCAWPTDTLGPALNQDVGKAIIGCTQNEVAEIRSLGKTLASWRDEISPERGTTTAYACSSTPAASPGQHAHHHASEPPLPSHTRRAL
jgi:hypothetical protein